MELPHLGTHCHQKDCKQLDFLPMKCDACSMIFCNDHIHYATHSCPESYKKDNQVPVCPLCNKPIPLKKGEVPDVVVGRHIDSDCQSDPAKERRKVYTNKCSMKGCKVKEMIPVKCDKCQQNYCLRHRFEDDHQCEGFENTGRSMSNTGMAALFRSKPTSSGSSKTKANNQAPQNRAQNNLTRGLGSELNRQREERIRQQQQQQRQDVQRSQTQAEKQLRAAQAGLSEEELMARAIQQSLSETQQPANTNQGEGISQEEEDRLLAQALAASEEEARRQRNNTQEEVIIIS
ncbi:AN1-type zinc finger protein 2A-like isoform X2 [Mya arenaria]|uniref:AN1-type zinc finger protein 2A-like isoform X2 n=1 Tax=Mya arenaria TaxID=6604 RepID=UPI0022E8068A|nr:AN1-type zinc finger protein 2A-like isoform X2 [Mya arenaria]